VVIYCLLIWKHLSINNVVASCVHNLRYWTKKGRTVIYSSPRNCSVLIPFSSIQHNIPIRLLLASCNCGVTLWNHNEEIQAEKGICFSLTIYQSMCSSQTELPQWRC
jgi:hypothetical protein